MDETDRKKLQRHYGNLCDVLYSSVSTHLISNFVIDLEMHAEIDALPTDKKKMEKLLMILPSRGSTAMTEFINALNPNYNWLADLLRANPDAAAPNATTTPPAPNILNNLNSSPCQNGNSNGVANGCNNSMSTSLLGNSAGNSENLKDIPISEHLVSIQRIFKKSVGVWNWRMLGNTMGIDRTTLGDIKRQMDNEGGTQYAVISILEAWVSKRGTSKATFANLISLTTLEGINDVTEALTELWRSLQ